MENLFYLYARISTKEKEDKQSFNRQEKGLLHYAKNNKIEYTLDFKDDCTGSTFKRPNWNKLEKIIKQDYRKKLTILMLKLQKNLVFTKNE